MKIRFIFSTAVFISTIAFCPLSSNDYLLKDELNTSLYLTSEYFPANQKNELIFASDFGDAHLNVKSENDLTVFTLKSDDFTYRQKLLINDSGVFVKETYQKVKLLLGINKQNNFTYNEGLPRIMFPIEVGKSWDWKGKEYEEDNTNTLNLTAKVEKIEKLKLPAGTFETIKIVTVIKSTSGTKSTVNEWYAKNVGMVKMSAVLEGGGILGTARDLLGLGEIVFELKEVKTK